MCLKNVWFLHLINDSYCLLRMYRATGGPWLSSDEFVRVEKDHINGGLYIATCAFHISHDVLYLLATETDDPGKGKDAQEQFCIREYVYNNYSGN